MLMVIFGAGASYDSCSSFPPQKSPRGSLIYRPPLAKELFLPIRDFRNLTNPRSRVLIPYLEDVPNVEEILEELQNEADDERIRQLLGVRYYLRDLLRMCQERWTHAAQGVSNYKTLIDQIRKHGDVVFVTFNYDTMLEGALADIDFKIESIHGYVAQQRFKVFKLHGSVDWVNEVELPGTSCDSGDLPEESAIRLAPQLLSTEIYRLDRDPPFSSTLTLPALAIPIVTKSSFTCPTQHVEDLKKLICHVDRILIVGWQGAEYNFVQMLADGLREGVRVLAVCGGTQLAEATLERLRTGGVRGEFQAEPDGFSEFVRYRRVRILLDTPPSPCRVQPEI